MSKMDDLRAMREARYDQAMARAAAKPQASPRPVQPVAPEAPAAPPPVPAPAADPGEQLCGHRAISGRTCTREHGHAAKSHRYS